MSGLFAVRRLVLLGHGAVLYGDAVERILQFVQSLPLDEDPALQLLKGQPQICIFNLCFAVTKDRMQQ